MKVPNFWASLGNLWLGNVHMHTAFWLCWMLPLILVPQLEMLAGSWVAFLYLPYLVISYVGAWRATREPIKSLWAPNIYRFALVIFLPIAILSLVDIVLSFAH